MQQVSTQIMLKKTTKQIPSPSTKAPMVEAWRVGLALGALFIFVTIFLPKGIVGTIAHGWNARKLMIRSREEEKARDYSEKAAAAEAAAEAAQ